MTETPAERDPVEALADEFAVRVRRGEFPSISEFVARHPEHADRLEKLLPTVAMMERLRAEEKSRDEGAFRKRDLPSPPEQLGDFRIIREIGRGGMGIVYEAEQKSLGRRVAVKVLPRHVLLLDKHLKRFQREAQTAARLQHTNIVPVFGAGQQDGLHYYVMPLVRGVGLDEIIRALSARRVRETHRTSCFAAVAQSLVAEKFPDEPPKAAPVDADRFRAAARVGLQAAEALAYAHDHGTLHRDVKPGNLLVDAEGAVSVADFGLARAFDNADVSRSGEVVGTLRYMAPEQFEGRADPRSDIYSLGLALYELVTLRSAFADTDRRQCLKSGQADAEPEPPRRIDPAIPRDLETILLKCLASEPSRRYQTAAAVADDLERFLDDLPIRARRVSTVERAWRWCRRNRALAAMSAVAAVLLIAVAGTAVMGYVHTRRAYSRTSAALARAEATSQLALDVLDDIYLHLSPDRARIASDADPGGDACTYVGLRSGGGSATPAERAAQQVQASRETATLLKDLLVFYDRLAEQDGSDRQLMLESATAGRRVGDIRQRLGQLDEAEAEYARAVEKLDALASSITPSPSGPSRPQSPRSDVIAISTELARCHNELGNVASARFDVDGAYDAHRTALFVLEPLEQNDALPADCRFELARTLYFLASKQPSGVARRRGLDAPEQSRMPRLNPYKTNQLRTRAIEILEGLAREQSGAPDYRFLLALCHRPAAFGPYSVSTAAGVEGRRKAIGILEELQAQYPGVVDYRYELAVTYAWIHVGLFPWQRAADDPAEAEASLRAALAESQWLVDHNPTIPDYARAQTLILAKLAMICRRLHRLDEAGDLLQQAIRNQEAAVAQFADLPPQNRVLLEFVRLRAAEVSCQEATTSGDPAPLEPCREQFQACIRSLTELTEKPELAEDRLAWSSLPVAYDALSRLLDTMGEDERAEKLTKIAKTIRAEMPDRRQDVWQ